MNNLIGELVYNKFSTNRIAINLKGIALERILIGCEIFMRYLYEELPNTKNPALKDDIRMMAKVVDGLRQLRDDTESEGNIVITISEFLTFKYGLECVAGLVGSLNLSDPLSIEYMDFIIYMDQLYGTLNENEVNVYYSFLASYDNLRLEVLN